MAVWQPLLVCETEKFPDPCHFGDFIQLIKNGITDLVLVSSLLAVAVFVYAGFILLTSGGNPGKATEAKGMLWKVVLGYAWIIGAWVLVYTITSAVLSSEVNFLLKK